MAYRQTLSGLRTAVRDNLDESTASYWTDARLNRCLTRAADAVWLEVRRVKKDYWLTNRASTDGSVTIYGDSYATSSFAIVAGTREYTLPQDLAELRLIECITSGYENVDFRRRAISDPDMRSARAITEQVAPGLFYFDVVDEKTLTLAPKSSVALDLRLWYVPRTVIVSTAGASLQAFATDTDELLLPHPLYMAVEEVATARAQAMDRDPTMSAWTGWARESVARFMAAADRQTMEGEVVRGVFE